LASAPFALNAQTVGGIPVSSVPQAGALLPLDQNGKLPKSVLPTGSQISSMDNMFGDVNGNIKIESGDPNTMKVTDDVPNNRIVLTVLPPSSSGTVIANQLTGSGTNKYSGSIPIPKNALLMSITYPGITATSNVIVTIKDPIGQTDQVSVSTITPGIGFNVVFAGYYPTSTGVLNYLVIN
jgi:hypothetical protein